MHINRIQDKSVFYWLRNLLTAYPTVNVVDEFPDENLVLPTVSVESDIINLVPMELGNRTGKRMRMFIIDVFGNNKEQRDELSGIILDDLESGIPVNDYSKGFPPSTYPSQIGTLIPIPDSITATPARVYPLLQGKIYWRTRIRFVAEYEKYN